MSSKTPVPTLFISYSHDSPDHSERVLSLSDKLRADGIDASIDQYEDAPSEGWPRWMINQIQASDHVIVVCTRTYNERFGDIGSRPGIGLGVKWEGAIITQELYAAEGHNEKFIPIVFSAADIRHIPTIMKTSTHYDISKRAAYEKLYRRITGQPETPKSELGKLRKLKARERKQFFSDVEPDGPGDDDHSPDRDRSEESSDDGQVAVETATTGIELLIDRDFDTYSDSDQQRLLGAIGELLNVTGDIRIINKRRGSVRLTLQLTYQQAEKLLWAAKQGQLENSGVVDASLVDLSAHSEPTDTARPFPELAPQLEKDLVLVFKLLSDETRLRILLYLIREGEMHINTLSDKLSQSQPAVQHHLAVLRTAGLIAARRDGKYNYYSVEKTSFSRIMEQLFESIGGERDEIRFEDFVLTHSGTKEDDSPDIPSGDG